MTDPSNNTKTLAERLRKATLMSEPSHWASLLAPAADALDRLQSELDREREARRWIPVSERVPENYVTVMVGSSAYPNVVGSGYIAEGGSWHWHNRIIDEPVTHWQPMPKPPTQPARAEEKK